MCATMYFQSECLYKLNLIKIHQCNAHSHFQGYCGWTNDDDADFDWMLGRGSTEDKFTGPAADHTLQNAKGTYLFIDASPPRLPGQKAVLVSEMVAPGEISCLEFWYHMWGQVSKS